MGFEHPVDSTFSDSIGGGEGVQGGLPFLGLLSKWGGSPGAESVPCRWTCFGRARLPNGKACLRAGGLERRRGEDGGEERGEDERGRKYLRKEKEIRAAMSAYLGASH